MISLGKFVTPIFRTVDAAGGAGNGKAPVGVIRRPARPQGDVPVAASLATGSGVESAGDQFTQAVGTTNTQGPVAVVRQPFRTPFQKGEDLKKQILQKYQGATKTFNTTLPIDYDMVSLLGVAKLLNQLIQLSSKQSNDGEIFPIMGDVQLKKKTDIQLLLELSDGSKKIVHVEVLDYKNRFSFILNAFEKALAASMHGYDLEYHVVARLEDYREPKKILTKIFENFGIKYTLNFKTS